MLKSGGGCEQFPLNRLINTRKHYAALLSILCLGAISGPQTHYAPRGADRLRC